MRVTSGSPLLLTKSLEAALATVNPRLDLTFRPFSDQLHASLTRERVMALLAGFFGVIALLLAGLGLYGVSAYAVSRRRAEIGIRLALGAAPRGVIRLVLGRIASLVIVGIIGGTVTSLWGSTFLRGLIYDMPPDDPAMLASAAVLLFATAVLSTWLPARRAAQIDPSILLRED